MAYSFREFLSRARRETNWRHMGKRDFGGSALTAILVWFFLPEKEAMEELAIIAIAAVASFVLWPAADFALNFVAAPFRILGEQLRSINEHLERLESPQSTGKATPEPDYAVWAKRREIRIDHAAQLMAGIHPNDAFTTLEANAFKGLLLEAVEHGEIARTDRQATRQQMSARGRIWNDVNYYTPLSLASLLDYLEREQLAQSFVEKVAPHVRQKKTEPR